MKVHLRVADEPIKPGLDTPAICGAVVRKAEFQFSVEGDLQLKDALNQLGNCRKCARKAITGRYIYGISEPVGLADAEAEEEAEEDPAAE